jgi:hypothetical protein
MKGKVNRAVARQSEGGFGYGEFRFDAQNGSAVSFTFAATP